MYLGVIKTTEGTYPSVIHLLKKRITKTFWATFFLLLGFAAAFTTLILPEIQWKQVDCKSVNSDTLWDAAVENAEPGMDVLWYMDQIQKLNNNIYFVKDSLSIPIYVPRIPRFLFRLIQITAILTPVYIANRILKSQQANEVKEESVEETEELKESEA